MIYKDSTKTREQQSMDRGQNPYAEGSRYYDLWESNPYTMDKMTQKQTAWDRLANMFGFRSAYDTAVDQRMQAAREYDAQIAQLQGEDKYNSPEEQAARMKAAGENPDLLGVEGGGTASEFAMEQTTPEVTPDENLTKIGQILNGVVQAITLASGMNDSILSTIGAAQTITGTKLDNIAKQEQLGDIFFKSWIPDKGELKDLDADNKEGMHEFLQRQARVWAEQRKLSKRQTKAFVESVSRRFESDKGAIFDKWTKNEESRRTWGLKAGSKYYTGDMEFQGIIESMQPLTELYDKYIDYSSSAKAQEAWDDDQYHTIKNGAIEAEAENAENSRVKQQSKLEEDERKARAEVMKKLTAQAQEGNKWAFFLSLILPVVWNRVEGAQMSGGSRRDSNGNTTSSSNWAF